VVGSSLAGKPTVRVCPLAQQGLVRGNGHLVLGWQVDPELHHVQRTAGFGESLRVEFFVQDAGARRHPLHIARADGAAGAGGVAMLDLTLVDDGDGLEAAVWMLTDAAPSGARRERGRAGVVQQ